MAEAEIRELLTHVPVWDGKPGPSGSKTTMTLRFINQPGRELDRVIFSRIAGNT